MTKKGFTLIELLVVLGLIAILAAILIAVIKPAEIFRRARDSQRSGDLRNLEQALIAYIVEKSQSGMIILDNATNTTCIGGTGSTTIYASAGYGIITSGLPSGFTRAVGTTSTAVNGSGWLPVDFASVLTLQLTKLPIDPLNTGTSSSPSLYYTYACKTDFTYELNANMESNTAAEQNDGGDAPWIYEVGPNKNILPTTTSTNHYPNAN